LSNDRYNRIRRVLPDQHEKSFAMTKISKWKILLNHNEWDRMFNIVPLPSGYETEKERSNATMDLSQKLSMFVKKRKRESSTVNEN
jgi:hypothetical protein